MTVSPQKKVGFGCTFLNPTKLLDLPRFIKIKFVSFFFFYPFRAKNDFHTISCRFRHLQYYGFLNSIFQLAVLSPPKKKIYIKAKPKNEEYPALELYALVQLTMAAVGCNNVKNHRCPQCMLC
jgi:hypothetical protein